MGSCWRDGDEAKDEALLSMLTEILQGDSLRVRLTGVATAGFLAAVHNAAVRCERDAAATFK